MLKNISVYLLTILSLFAQNAFSQRVLTGKVIDAQTHLPVPAATLSGGNSASIVADDNGAFEWKAAAGTQQIIVTSVGYLPKTVIIKESTKELLIFLDPAGYNLNTVQVKGWSTAKKENQLDVAQSVGVLTSEDFHRNN